MVRASFTPEERGEWRTFNGGLAVSHVASVLSWTGGFGETTRPDLWWLKPLVVFFGLPAFVIYSTWAAFQSEFYAFGSCFSPMYSPELFGETPHAILGPQPGWWPG